MSEEKKVFDNWTDVVDCNDCAKYWDDSCDGLSKGSKRLCNSFLATRSVVIPLQIKALRTHLKWLYSVVILEAIAIVILGVYVLG